MSHALNKKLSGSFMMSERNHVVTPSSKDSSRRKPSQDAADSSEALHTNLVHTISDVLIRTDMEGRILFVNDFTTLISGYDRDEIEGQNMLAFISPDDRDRLIMNTFRMVEHRLGPQEYKIVIKDGSCVPFEVNGDVFRSSDGTPLGLVFVCRDIREREKVVEALYESKERYRLLFENAIEGIFQTTLNGQVLLFNAVMAKMLGYHSSQDAINKINDISYQIYTNPEDRRELMNSLFQAGKITGREVLLKRVDGDYLKVILNLRLVHGTNGKDAFIEGSCIDITEKWLAEETLKENEEKYRKIFESATEGIFQMTPNGRYLSVNPAFAKMFGYASPQEMIDSVTDIERQHYVNPKDREEMLRLLRENNTLKGFEVEAYHKDRRRFWISFNVHAVCDDAGNIIYFEGTSADITERKQAEEKFQKIYMMSPEGIAITRFQDGIIMEVNKGFEEITGWKREIVIGTRSIEPPMKLLVNSSDYEIMVADLQAGRDVLHRQIDFRRSDGSIRSGIYSARSININDEENIIFVLQDVTEHKKMEEELQRTLDSLRKALNTTINVMISTIEMRDPYTAGHQKRSSDLARAIAVEMALDQDKIDAIHMAGTIHDIGKLSIPAEILTKPTRLTDIELSIVKEHPRNGYEILKNVETGWPLAEMIYQHHERVNGTGYPRNLKGDEIIIEARILAVADVVEAMASHRPYRASLGVEKALGEIEKNKGILYDSDVVDACQRLFRQKNYQLIED